MLRGGMLLKSRWPLQIGMVKASAFSRPQVWTACKRWVGLCELPIDTNKRKVAAFPGQIEIMVDLDFEDRDEHMPERFKAKLTTRLQDLHLTRRELEIFTNLCQKRVDTKKGTVSFVSREMPTAVANENRVMDLLESAVAESKALALRFMTEDVINGETYDGAYDDELDQRERIRLSFGLPKA